MSVAASSDINLPRDWIRSNNVVVFDMAGALQADSGVAVDVVLATEIVEAIKAVEQHVVIVNARQAKVELDSGNPNWNGGDIGKLSKLIFEVGSGEWYGLVVIVLPDSISASEILSLLTTPTNLGLMTLEQLHQNVNSFLRRPLINAIALADRHVSKGNMALIVGNPPGQLTRAVSDFKIVRPEFAKRIELFQTLLGRQKFEFSPVAHASIAEHFDPELLKRDCGKYGIELQQLYGEWLHQEFESGAATNEVIALVSETFELQNQSKPPLLPREWQTAIGAIRLARRMATWTLEGQAFECSVLLMTANDYAETIENHQLRHDLVSVFRFSDNIQFDFADLRLVREAAELAQSPRLFIGVDVTNGKLQSIVLDNKDIEDVSRHDRFEEIAGRKRLLLHVRSGFLEVYGRHGLRLWHDGFRWVVRPFERLTNLLAKHFNGRVDNPALATKKIIGAISSLMDRRQGSTVILLHEKDTNVFERHAGELLRDNLNQVVRLAVNQLPLEPLTSILHLDGAHAILQSAEIKHLARRIDAGSGPAFMAAATGTGTRAARSLAEKLSVDSHVLRISSSGYIRFFCGGPQT